MLDVSGGGGELYIAYGKKTKTRTYITHCGGGGGGVDSTRAKMRG